jgi:alcohol dehydrogenase, propanol-preferring
MKAMVLREPGPISGLPLRAEEVQLGPLAPDAVRIRVLACGVCRTDLHIATGELPPRHAWIVPGHQIVGEIVEAADRARIGHRVGVSWLGGVDGTCQFCRSGFENLCDHPVFTGYDRNGGYAEYVDARSDFALDLFGGRGPLQTAPLLCAGIIGFRALRVAGVARGERVGLFGFGASAHLAAQVLRHWECEIFVSTRGASHRALALGFGASWVGDATERPPELLDRAITFAPSGDVVVAALSSLRKGGVVAINAIHLDRMPEFDYDRLLWGERQIRSVTNMTREDARDFLALADEIPIEARVQTFPLERANQALEAVANDAVDGAAVLIP